MVIGKHEEMKGAVEQLVMTRAELVVVVVVAADKLKSGW